MVCVRGDNVFLSILLAICTEERFTYQIFLRLCSVWVIQKGRIFIRSTSIKSRKAWCWHRLPSPCSANRTRRRGRRGRRLLPQWLETTIKSTWLLSLAAISSGWNSARVEEEEEGALLFGDEREKCLDFHRMACRLSGSLLESVSQGLSHAGVVIVDSTKTTWQRRRLNPGRRVVFM